MTRPLCVVTTLLLLNLSPAAAQERGALALDERGERYALSLDGKADALSTCGTAECEIPESRLSPQADRVPSSSARPAHRGRSSATPPDNRGDDGLHDDHHDKQHDKGRDADSCYTKLF